MKKRLTKKMLSKKLKEFVTSIDGVEEALIGLPLITITGGSSIRVENFSNIVEYGQNLIKLKTKIGVLSITGKNLLAKSMNQEEIIIRGKISGVNLE